MWLLYYKSCTNDRIEPTERICPGDQGTLQAQMSQVTSSKRLKKSLGLAATRRSTGLEQYVLGSLKSSTCLHSCSHCPR